MNDDGRPDPDDLLRFAKAEDRARRSGRLRLFLGMSAGVGKTYAMLQAAHRARADGRDVVIGLVETHGRKETAALLAGLEEIPRLEVEHRGARLGELDLDAVLRRKPEIVVVDELAHSNAPGVRHRKRWQDVLELLDAGIDVLAALNVQHLESRKDAVESITLVPIRETVPDSLLERASQIELVDIAPSELLKRLSEGKVYLGDGAARAAQNFFREDKLTALREIALRITAERVDQDLQRFGGARQGGGPWQTNERLMVAISHSPYSETLIRAARRIAFNLEAPWIAAHVDGGAPLSDEDAVQLAKNLALARELKAEVVSTLDTDVAAALKRIARQKNVTQILVGRPGGARALDLIAGGSLLDRLVRECREIDVHVVRQNDARAQASARAGARWQAPVFASGPLAYGKTLCFVAAVAACSGLAEPWIGYRAVGFVFLLAVLGVGLVGRTGPVAFSAALSALVWNFFFIPPRLTFAMQAPDDTILCVAFAVAALVTGTLTARVRRHERLIREREERTNVLYEVLQEVANSGETSELLTKTLALISRVMDGRCGVFLPAVSGDGLAFDFEKPYAIPLDEKARAVASWAHEAQAPAGWSTDALSEAPALFLPLRGSYERVGVFVFAPREPGRRFGLDQSNLLNSAVRQLALSLERRLVERRLQETRRLEESARLHEALLNSISHEMRTPLSALIGAASALSEEGASQDPALVKALSAQLLESGDRLNRAVENLLDMTRLDSGAVRLKLEWHDAQDLIGVTLNKLGRALRGRRVRTAVPDGLPVVKMDFRLMEHALANVVANALAYGPPQGEVAVSAEARDGVLRVFVDDQGPGIAESARRDVFNKFYRVPGTPAGGLGLGLSIVKAIVEAHGGSVEAGARPDGAGGARFTLALPAHERAPGLPNEG